jgi:muramoyltetrapeptide carboxypeptidase LdcA involved in peptidoglycan recycling
VLVGRVEARSPRVSRDAAARADYRERVRDTVAETFETYNPAAPVVFGVDFGHTAPVVPVPVGGVARIDPGERTIAFDLH